MLSVMKFIHASFFYLFIHVNIQIFNLKSFVRKKKTRVDQLENVSTNLEYFLLHFERRKLYFAGSVLISVFLKSDRKPNRIFLDHGSIWFDLVKLGLIYF